jgi:hypothetical protein
MDGNRYPITHSAEDFVKTTMKIVFILLPAILILSGCGAAGPITLAAPTVVAETSMSTATLQLTVMPTTASELSAYAFPISIDPSKQYLFYLHCKIIKDQGSHATSPVYGEYEFEAILQKLSGYGFVVISEQRPENTDVVEYASKVTEQAKTLLNAGVPANNISVVGASKGAGIAIYVSHFLENEKTNFVIMGICHPDTVESLKQDKIHLYGNVLSIFDASDEVAGSYQELFSVAEGKGLAQHDEIVLHLGIGHGILFKALDEWVMPAVQWAGGK